MNVDTQPAAEAAVSGDPHGEGFDFGPHVSFRLDQNTGNFKAAIPSRPNQWSVITEGKQKKSTCANRVSLQKNINNHSVRGGNYWKLFASIY